MRSSYSPGCWVVLIYLITIPIAITLGIFLFIKLEALGEFLMYSAGNDWFSFIIIIGAFAVLFVQYFGMPVLLVGAVIIVGRMAIASEQKDNQKTRDYEAARLNKSLTKKKSIDDYPQYFDCILYLRPFSSTGKISLLFKHSRHFYSLPYQEHQKTELREIRSDLETILAQAVEPLGTFIALGRPGENIGAGRILTSEENWKDIFIDIAGYSRKILVVPSTHPGTKWEIAHLLSDRKLLEKTLLIIPPSGSFIPSGVYYGHNESYTTTYQFYTEMPNRAEVSDIRTDVMEALKQMNIQIPAYDNGAILKIGKSGYVRMASPFWVEHTSLAKSLWNWVSSQDNFKISLAHIRDTIGY